MSTLNHTHGGSWLAPHRRQTWATGTHTWSWDKMLGVCVVVAVIAAAIAAGAVLLQPGQPRVVTHHPGAHGRVQMLETRKLSGNVASTQVAALRGHKPMRGHNYIADIARTSAITSLAVARGGRTVSMGARKAPSTGATTSSQDAIVIELLGLALILTIIALAVTMVDRRAVHKVRSPGRRRSSHLPV
jgi:hypothetical protein